MRPFDLACILLGGGKLTPSNHSTSEPLMKAIFVAFALAVAAAAAPVVVATVAVAEGCESGCN